MCLSTATLRGHGNNVVAADDEDALVLDQLTILDKEDTSVDVEDFALSTFAAMLLDIVFVPDFVTITVGGYSEAVLAHGLRHSGMKQLANIAVLIDDI